LRAPLGAAASSKKMFPTSSSAHSESKNKNNANANAMNLSERKATTSEETTHQSPPQRMTRMMTTKTTALKVPTRTTNTVSQENMVAKTENKVPTNNTSNGATATSIRIFRHELLDGIGIGGDNSNTTTNDQSSYTHSVNLVPSDLKDCKNGDDVLQKAVQLAKKYNSFLFSFDDDGELANKIRNNEKRITYNFQNLDPSSSQFKAMTIHDILKVKRNRYGPGRETVRIEMTINDVIQRTSGVQHESFIMC